MTLLVLALAGVGAEDIASDYELSAMALRERLVDPQEVIATSR